MARLKDLYQSKIISELTKEFNYKNPMAVPHIQKVVISMGVGKAVQDKKFLELAKKDLMMITGQPGVLRLWRSSGQKREKWSCRRSCIAVI